MSLFRFKQFNVNQTGCAMKVNTDGVLLGALANTKSGDSVLDIGTGTGVIALMLAQRFPHAKIDAVELDAAAAQTAGVNFNGSPFACRLSMHAQSFQDHFAHHPESKFDLIASNPPFYIQSLPSAGAQKKMAKHAGDGFFAVLITGCAAHLTKEGSLWLILPIATSALVRQLAGEQGLYIQQQIIIKSYPHSDPHREILVLGHQQTKVTEHELIIYTEPKVYTQAYTTLLKDFLTIF